MAASSRSDQPTSHPKRRGAVRCLASVWTLVTGLLLAACAGPSTLLPGQLPPGIFDDTAFAGDRFEPDPRSAWLLTDAMRRALEAEVRPKTRSMGTVRGLIDVLSGDGVLHIDYDASVTRNAGEAFDARKGNCLSMVLLTAAFAEELGLEVRFQKVLTEDLEESTGDLMKVVGHVNLGVAKRGAVRVREWTTIDFLIIPGAARLQTRAITAARVQSMYYTNKAVESLSRKQLGEAYWWARASALNDPAYAGSYVTLGVIWQQWGDFDRARRAFEQALALDPGNASAIANLANSSVASGHTGPMRQTQLPL